MWSSSSVSRRSWRRPAGEGDPARHRRGAADRESIAGGDRAGGPDRSERSRHPLRPPDRRAGEGSSRAWDSSARNGDPRDDLHTMAFGVDSITTDRPDLALDLRRKMQ